MKGTISKRFLKIICLALLGLSINANAQNDFNTKSFINIANDIVSSIAEQKIILKNKADILSFKKFSSENLSALNLSKARRFLKHTFDAGKLNRNLSIWIVDVIYISEKEAKLAFIALQKTSGSVNEEFDQTPGLTYTNDYVIRDKNRILWLNTGCLYSKENHFKLIEAFKKSLEHEIDETIACECGEVQCQYSRAR